MSEESMQMAGSFADVLNQPQQDMVREILIEYVPPEIKTIIAEKLAKSCKVKEFSFPQALNCHKKDLFIFYLKKLLSSRDKNRIIYAWNKVVYAQGSLERMGANFKKQKFETAQLF